MKGAYLGHEGGVLVSGISALVEEVLRAPHHSHPVRAQQKDSIYWPGSGPSLHTEAASTLIQTSQPRTTRNEFLLFISHPVSAIVLPQPKRTQKAINRLCAVFLQIASLLWPKIEILLRGLTH